MTEDSTLPSRRAQLEALRQSGAPVLVYIARGPGCGHNDLSLETRGTVVALEEPSRANRVPDALDVHLRTTIGRVTLRSHGIGWRRYFFAEQATRQGEGLC